MYHNETAGADENITWLKAANTPERIVDVHDFGILHDHQALVDISLRLHQCIMDITLLLQCFICSNTGGVNAREHIAQTGKHKGKYPETHHAGFGIAIRKKTRMMHNTPQP